MSVLTRLKWGKSVLFSESSIHKTMFEARVLTISKVLGARLRTNHQDNNSVAQSTIHTELKFPVQSQRRTENANEMASTYETHDCNITHKETNKIHDCLANCRTNRCSAICCNRSQPMQNQPLHIYVLCCTLEASSHAVRQGHLGVTGRPSALTWYMKHFFPIQLFLATS